MSPDREPTAAEPLPRCEWCTDNGLDHRRVGSKPFSVWLRDSRDSDGQPDSLIVTYSAGHHVGEGEAEYVRRALRAYQESAVARDVG